MHSTPQRTIASCHHRPLDRKRFARQLNFQGTTLREKSIDTFAPNVLFRTHICIGAWNGKSPTTNRQGLIPCQCLFSHECSIHYTPGDLTRQTNVNRLTRATTYNCPPFPTNPQRLTISSG